MKKTIKPFDLEAAKNGAKVEMKIGYKVEILKWDIKNPCPIAGVIKITDTYEQLGGWMIDGKWIGEDDDNPDYDLVIVEYENEEDK